VCNVLYGHFTLEIWKGNFPVPDAEDRRDVCGW